MTETKTLKNINRILIIFFFSGIAGLAYQVLWGKLLSQIFGHTIFAISTVVAAFMAGLALGSYFFGKWADKVSSPLRLYAFLEFGIGLYALLILLLFSTLDSVYSAFFSFFELGFSTFSLSRMFYAFLILIIPTALIGGTFPVISRFYIREVDQVNRGSGLLYTVNTAGAVSGALLTGFFLLEWCGISVTTYIMICVNLLLGVSALYLEKTGHSFSHPAEETKQSSPASFVLIIYALSGFVSLALEVLWTRELTIVFLSSTYSFSTVLVSFLIGLSAGSMYLSRKGNIRNPIAYFYRIEFGIALSALLSLPLLRYLPQEFYIQRLIEGSISWEFELVLNFTISFAVLILPTFLMGMAFPLVCSLFTRSEAHIGSDIGRVYAYNTIGAIFGSLTAGFFLIPVLGVLHAILAMAVLSFLLALALIVRFTAFRQLRLEHLLMAVVFFITLIIIYQKTGSFRPLQEGMKVVYSREDISAEVKVLEDKGGELALYINEKQQGGTRVVQTERWTGQVPLVFQARPDSVLLIGLGTGVTLKALSEGPVQHITCVDLIGSLVQAADKFSMINGSILQNKEKISFIEADGINYLNLSQNKFDLIICDIVHPDDAGAGDLYSVEFYQTCRDGLTLDGHFVQWILLDQLAPPDLKLILATFNQVFPAFQLYLGQEQTVHQKLMLIGARTEIALNIEQVAENLNNLPFFSEFPGRNDPYSFLSYFISSGSLLKEKLVTSDINTREHPVLEYQSPRHRWLNGKSIINLDLLRGFRQPVTKGASLSGASDSLVQAYFNTRTDLLQGRLLAFHKKYEQADFAYSTAALNDIDTLLVAQLLEQNAANLASQRKSDLAVTAYKKSLAVNHYNTSASFALAEYLLHLKREEEAIEFFRYTAHYDPDNYHALRRLGDIYTARKDFDNALYYYQLSLSRYDDQSLLHYILGQIYENYKNEPDNALRSFRRSLELNPYHHYNQRAKEAITRLGKDQ